MKKLLLVIFTLCQFQSLAQNFNNFPHSSARVISNFSSVSADTKEILISLEIKLDPEWHTYWLNPGDSGTAPTFTIEAQGGKIESSDIDWPTPVRIDYPPLTSISYVEKVLLSKKVSLKNIATDQLDFEISAEWLVCKVECVPAFGDFTLHIPVGAAVAHNQEVYKNRKNPLPEDLTLQSTYSTEGSTQILGIPPQGTFVDFFALPNQGLDNKPGNFDVAYNTLSITQESSSNESTLKGLVLYKENNLIKSHWAEFKQDKPSWILFALFAFLGGLILNLMPCVLPILSLKAFALVKHSNKNNTHIRNESLSYSLGVLVTFLLASMTLHVLRLQGEALGWGFQLQEPAIIAAMILLFTTLSLNFLSLYEFQVPGINSGASLTQKGSLAGSFFTGMLSVLVASPCTAPFMGAAMGFALTQDLSINLSIFTFLALGFAFPFLLLAISPRLSRFFPKPGAWMATFKTFMFFPMLLTVLWLLWVFALQRGLSSTVPLALATVYLSFCIWWQSLYSKKRIKLSIWILAVVGVIFLSDRALIGNASTPSAINNYDSGIQWEEFTREELDRAINNNEAAFVDFTAAWCISCQVNEQVVFANLKVLDYIEQNKIRMFKADWTNRAPHITRELEKYNRFSVPLYLYFAPGNSSPVILPELLTPEGFLQKLEDKNSYNNEGN